MDKIKLYTRRIVQSYSSSNAYTLVLAEEAGKRKLPIVIGEYEAQAIALSLEKLSTPRPLTHELMKEIMNSFHLKLIEVVIEDFLEGVFFSTMVLSNGEKTISVDSRTSDAVALALKFDAPIYALENVLEVAGIVFEDDFDTDEGVQTDNENVLSTYSLGELKEMLKDAEYYEEYEKASKIMQEIHNRESTSNK